MSSPAPGTLEDHVARQFGAQAEAYVTSAVHARGPDLDALDLLLAGQDHGRLLDLGCGGGHVSFTAAPHVAQVTAYDLSPAMLEVVAAEAGRRGFSNIATVQGAAEALPFEDASFDVVASRYSAHHWRDLAGGLRHARRVVAPDGRAVFMDVVAPENPLLDTFLQTIEMLRDPSHVRDYRASEWIRAAEAAGFIVETLTERRLRLDFGPWVTRIATPADHVATIRSLQRGASDEVQTHFAIEADGTFTLDTLTLVLMPA